jgi:hypothetical protein
LLFEGAVLGLVHPGENATQINSRISEIIKDGYDLMRISFILKDLNDKMNGKVSIFLSKIKHSRQAGE